MQKCVSVGSTPSSTDEVLSVQSYTNWDDMYCIFVGTGMIELCSGFACNGWMK